MITLARRRRDARSARSIAQLITLSVVASCGGFSTSDLIKTSGSSSSPAGAEGDESRGSGDDGATAPDARAAPDAERDLQLFAGLTDEANKKNARNFKNELRIGELPGLFDEGAAFDAVAEICGVKLWDQCEVAYVPGVKKRNYPQYAFRRKDGGEVHRFPDFFDDKTEPLWAKKAVGDILARGSAGPTLLTMVQDRCGDPLDEQCQVRRVAGYGYVLTVRKTGEVIEIWKTLSEWEADL